MTLLTPYIYADTAYSITLDVREKRYKSQSSIRKQLNKLTTIEISTL